MGAQGGGGDPPLGPETWGLGDPRGLGGRLYKTPCNEGGAFPKIYLQKIPKGGRAGRGGRGARGRGREGSGRGMGMTAFLSGVCSVLSFGPFFGDSRFRFETKGPALL